MLDVFYSFTLPHILFYCRDVNSCIFVYHPRISDLEVDVGLILNPVPTVTSSMTGQLSISMIL